MNDLSEFLHQTKITEVLKPKSEVIIVKANDSVESASQILANKNILSAPVFDPEQENWLGFIDVFDILGSVLSIYSKAENFRAEEAKWADYVSDIDEAKHRGIRFSLKPVKSVMNLLGNNPFIPVNKNGTLFQLIEDVFFRGIHRTAVMDENLQRPIGIISQSDIIKYLASNCLQLLNIVRHKTVKELDLGTRNVIQMSASSQAIHAFYLMYFNRVSAVAIVQNGVLVANLSTSDIRGITSNNFSILLQPIMEFIRNKKEDLITCTEDSTFSSVLMKMAFYGVHRVWLVDQQDRPIGIISTTDIMKALETCCPA